MYLQHLYKFTLNTLNKSTFPGETGYRTHPLPTTYLFIIYSIC